MGLHVSKRFVAWLNPFDQANYDAIGGSYQLVQGIFGLSHGNLLGTGLGGGLPLALGRTISGLVQGGRGLILQPQARAKQIDFGIHTATAELAAPQAAATNVRGSR